MNKLMIPKIIAIRNMVLFILINGPYNLAIAQKAIVKKPNVIIIMTDDQGYGDLGFHGNPLIKTPTLDNFARESVRFDQFAVSPVCAPTRAALMTGRYSLRTGVRDTYRGGAIMSTHEITIAEMLKAIGYKTGMIGKWHLGDNYPSRPQDQGFDFTLRHLSGGIGQPGDWPNTEKRDSSYFDPVLWKNGKRFQSKGYCSDVFTNVAIDFIDKNREEPFFLYLSYNAPHAPLQVPRAYYDMYKDIDPSQGFENDGRPFPKMDEPMKENARKVYGMVSNIDDNLKKLFHHLEDLQLKDNTLVIFLTDNGPQHNRYIAGMRGRKSYVYQGGIRVPSFWSLPSQFTGNRDIETPAAHYDVLPTLAELCGAQLPKDRVMDGISLLPVLKNEQSNFANRSMVRSWVRGGPEKYNNISISKAPYKLVGNCKPSDSIENFELFNMVKDPFELNNIVDDNIEEAQKLKGEMDSWLATMLNTKNFLTEQPAIIGTIHENPSVLNLNDGIFKKEENLGKEIVEWKIEVAEAGHYDVKIHFLNKIVNPGKLNLKIGEVEFISDFEALPNKSIYFENIELTSGIKKLTPVVTVGHNEYVKPFYVEINKNDL